MFGDAFPWARKSRALHPDTCAPARPETPVDTGDDATVAVMRPMVETLDTANLIDPTAWSFHDPAGQGLFVHHIDKAVDSGGR